MWALAAERRVRSAELILYVCCDVQEVASCDAVTESTTLACKPGVPPVDRPLHRPSSPNTRQSKIIPVLMSDE